MDVIYELNEEHIEQLHRLQLGVMVSTLPFLLVILSSFIFAFSDWKAVRAFSMMPLVACAGSVVIALAIGSQLRDVKFHWFEDEYSAVVRRLEANIHAGESLKAELESNEKMLAYSVWARKDDSGELVVTFFTGGGFPVSHSGYLYSASGDFPTDSASEMWDRPQKLSDHWFFVAD